MKYLEKAIQLYCALVESEAMVTPATLWDLDALQEALAHDPTLRDGLMALSATERERVARYAGGFEPLESLGTIYQFGDSKQAASFVNWMDISGWAAESYTDTIVHASGGDREAMDAEAITRGGVPYEGPSLADSVGWVDSSLPWDMHCDGLDMSEVRECLLRAVRATCGLLTEGATIIDADTRAAEKYKGRLTDWAQLRELVPGVPAMLTEALRFGGFMTDAMHLGLLEQQPGQAPAEAPQPPSQARDRGGISDVQPDQQANQGDTAQSQTEPQPEPEKPTEHRPTEEEGGPEGDITMPDGTPIPKEILQQAFLKFLAQLQTKLQQGTENGQSEPRGQEAEAGEEEEKPPEEEPVQPPQPEQPPPQAGPDQGGAPAGQQQTGVPKQESVLFEGKPFGRLPVGAVFSWDGPAVVEMRVYGGVNLWGKSTKNAAVQLGAGATMRGRIPVSSDMQTEMAPVDIFRRYRDTITAWQRRFERAPAPEGDPLLEDPVGEGSERAPAPDGDPLLEDPKPGIQVVFPKALDTRIAEGARGRAVGVRGCRVVVEMADGRRVTCNPKRVLKLNEGYDTSAALAALRAGLDPMDVAAKRLGSNMGTRLTVAEVKELTGTNVARGQEPDVRHFVSRTDYATGGPSADDSEDPKRTAHASTGTTEGDVAGGGANPGSRPPQTGSKDVGVHTISTLKGDDRGNPLGKGVPTTEAAACFKAAEHLLEQLDTGQEAETQAAAKGFADAADRLKELRTAAFGLTTDDLVRLNSLLQAIGAKPAAAKVEKIRATLAGLSDMVKKAADELEKAHTAAGVGDAGALQEPEPTEVEAPPAPEVVPPENGNEVPPAAPPPENSNAELPPMTVGEAVVGDFKKARWKSKNKGPFQYGQVVWAMEAAGGEVWVAEDPHTRRGIYADPRMLEFLEGRDFTAEDALETAIYRTLESVVPYRIADGGEYRAAADLIEAGCTDLGLTPLQVSDVHRVASHGTVSAGSYTVGLNAGETGLLADWGDAVAGMLADGVGTNGGVRVVPGAVLVEVAHVLRRGGGEEALALVQRFEAALGLAPASQGT